MALRDKNAMARFPRITGSWLPKSASAKSQAEGEKEVCQERYWLLHDHDPFGLWPTLNSKCPRRIPFVEITPGARIGQNLRGTTPISPLTP